MAQFFEHFNFKKYKPIFKIISLSESAENLQYGSYHTSIALLHYLVKCQMSQKQQQKTRHYLVIITNYLLQIFFWFWEWNNFENLSIFGKV